MTLTGRLEADRRVEIRARVTGILEEIGFAPGDIVEEGQLLYRIERGPYAAAVQEAEGAVISARADRDLAFLERDRQRELVARDASPQALLDQAEAALGQAEGNLVRLEGARASAVLQLGYTEITAPFTGRIGVSAVDAGALVGPETGPLVTLTDLDPVHAEASVTTATFRRFMEAVAAGTATTEGSATLILANGSGYDRPGSVDFVDSAIDPGTDSVPLRVRFDNPEGRLLDRELVRVVITEGSARPVLSIPQQGVQRDVSGAFVMLVDDAGTVVRRPVTVARTDRGLAVISDGLSEGERVIVEGVNKVRPGIVVDAAEAADSAQGG
jgi:membrane fusion protein (multidrug efflux system)